MSCTEKPNFVIVKQTGLGFSFDNNVTYNSPLASHTLSQAQGVSHPSLQVTSDWGINSKNTITQLLTGKAAQKLVNTGRGHLGTRELLIKKKKNKKTGRISLVSRFGLISPSISNRGYTLARIGNKNEGLSVSELAMLLRDISNKTSNIKVRGSPLEYKRLLDYIQFLMVEKVTNNDKLFLARPNDYRVMEAVHTDDISLEAAYNGIDENNSTMYGKAYFVTQDRVAALASVVRKIPTLYQTGSHYYYNVNTKVNNKTVDSIPKIREILSKLLKDENYTMPKTTANGYTNRIQQLTTPSGRPVITSGPIFAWFLDTRNIGEKMNDGKTRTVGSNFHKLKNSREKALVLFYWVFNYPGSTDENIKVIKYFLAILDTFHDFTDKKRIGNFKKMWPESDNTAPHTNAKTKTRNGISIQNIPQTSEQHKFLVKLLGIDIYRKVDEYNNTITSTLSKSNKRGGIPIQLRVAHFLYFITNLLGSQPSRGFIAACEDLSTEIMIKLSNDTYINKPFNFGKNICNLLDEEKSCIVIDTINGSVPTCMKKYSVFHNVGILDPTDKGILSWGEILGEDGCIESAKVKAFKKKAKKEREKLKKIAKSKKERIEAAKETRARRIKNEAAAKAKAKIDAEEKARKARARRNALSKRRGIKPNTKQVNNKKPVNNKKLNEKFRNLGNMKMNISKVNQTPKPQTAKRVQTPKPQTASGARITAPKNPVFNFKRNGTTNNGVNNMNVNNGVANRQRVINNFRLELNKLTSLRPNQKNNYLEKIKETPNNILNILNNAKRVASTQRATRSRTPARTPK